jgi:hypothetical protein
MAEKGYRERDAKATKKRKGVRAFAELDKGRRGTGEGNFIGRIPEWDYSTKIIHSGMGALPVNEEWIKHASNGCLVYGIWHSVMHKPE